MKVEWWSVKIIKMTLSDLISFIGILLAILAFIGVKERRYVINKFRKRDVLFVILIFTYINFLIFYNWWYNNVSFFKKFEFEKFPTPNTWAYLVTVGLMGFLIYKIFIAKFPTANKKKVLNYYKHLLQTNDYFFLYNLLWKNERQMLIVNPTPENNVALINLIFNDYLFLNKTSNYNYSFFNDILIKNYVEIPHLINNYVETHLMNPNGFIYNLNEMAEEKEIFFKLLDKSENLEFVIVQIAKNELVSVNKVMLFAYEYSLKSDKAEKIFYLLLQVILNNGNSLILYDFMRSYLSLAKKSLVSNGSFYFVTDSLIEAVDDLTVDKYFEKISETYLLVLKECFSNNPDQIQQDLKKSFIDKRTQNSKKLSDIMYKHYRANPLLNCYELNTTFDLIYNN